MTTIGPGDSWQTAYKAAAPGEVITLSPGIYGAVQLDRVPGRAGDPVVFKGGPGVEVQSIASGRSGGSVTAATGADRWALEDVKVRAEVSLRWGSDNVRLQRVDAGNVRVTSVRNFEALESDFGPFVDQVATVNSAGGSAPGVFDILFEDCVFHDYTISDAAKHAEGMQIWPGAASERVTLRRCRFVNCTDFDLLVKAPSLKDLLVEDSVWDVPMPGNKATVLCNPNCGERWGSAIRLSSHVYPGAVIRNNTIKKPAQIVVDIKTGVTETGNTYVDELPPVGPPVPPEPPADTLPLTELSPPGADPVTLGWTPVPGAVGYRFTKDGKIVSHSWNGSLSQTKFSRGGELGVEALLPGPSGDWPN